jgi:hypothetical protein
MGTMILGLSVTGWLFAVVTTVLFVWGVWMALLGMRAPMPGFHEGGHAPGAKGSFDPHNNKVA